MIVFIILYFLTMIILLYGISKINKKKTFNNVKKDYLIIFWILTIILILLAINNKSTPLVLLLPIIIWLLNQFVYYKVERNIKERKIKEEQLKQEKEKYINNKKSKLIYKCIDIFSNYTYIPKEYKSKELNHCLYIINNIKTIADINIAINDCQRIIDKLYELNKDIKDKSNANNKKKSNSTSYTYTVNGALSLFKLTANSTTDEIKSVYRKLAKVHHPDRGGNKDNFLKLNAAYETLKKHYNF